MVAQLGAKMDDFVVPPWYHSPVSGQVVGARDDIAGEHYGMRDFPELFNDGNVGHGFDCGMVEHSWRDYLVIDTIGPGTPPVPVAKGERIGNFQYGGSLNVLLFEEHVFPAVQSLQGRRIGPLGTPGKPTSYFTGHRRVRAQHLELRPRRRAGQRRRARPGAAW